MQHSIVGRLLSIIYSPLLRGGREGKEGGVKGVIKGRMKGLMEREGRRN